MILENNYFFKTVKVNVLSLFKKQYIPKFFYALVLNAKQYYLKYNESFQQEKLWLNVADKCTQNIFQNEIKPILLIQRAHVFINNQFCFNTFEQTFHLRII